MNQYQVTITGKTDLLMHQDNIDWADHMKAWETNPENKKNSKAGDDRTPAWRWIGSTYNDGEYVVIPSGNLMRSLMEGGAMVPVPGGRSGKTFKAQTQSGMMCVEPFWRLTTHDGRQIKWAEIERLKDINDFAAQRHEAEKLGFELFVKRARVGQNKHVRVRPLFRKGWTITGSIMVWDEQITANVLNDILKYAGDFKGLGDWRPGGRTPGSYGMFLAKIK